MSSNTIVLGQTQVTAENYQDYIKKLQDEANARQDVSQSDLAPLEQFLGMSGANSGTADMMQSAASTLGISVQQLSALQNDVTGLDTIVQMGSSSGYMGASSQHGSATTNQLWADNIDELLAGASAASGGVADPATGMSSGGISAAGTINSGTGAATSGSVTFPSNSPLAQAASQSGAAVNYNADNNLFTVSNSSGVQLYSGAGQPLGNVPSTGLKVNITNPHDPSLGYVNIDAAGNMTNSSGSTGQFADLTIQGSGSGQYTGGNTVGVGGISGGSVTFPPGSDAAKFAQTDGTNLADPTAIKAASNGSMAIKGKDNLWHVFDSTGKAAGTAPTSGGSVSISAVSSSISGATGTAADTFTVTSSGASFGSQSAMAQNSASSVSGTSGLSGAAATAAAGMSASGVSNAAAKTTSDGRTILYEKVGGVAQFAIFNPDGSQQVPANGGWQQIQSSINGGKGTVDLANGQFMNFDTTGFTIDASNNNKGTPLKIADLSKPASDGDTNAYTNAMSSWTTGADLHNLSINGGGHILFYNDNGQGKYAIFNADGSQRVPQSGWEPVLPTINAGKGTIDLGNGQYFNFSTDDASIDNKNNNAPALPLSIVGNTVVANSAASTDTSSSTDSTSSTSSATGSASTNTSLGMRH